MKHFNGLFVSAAAVAIVLSSSVGIAQAGIALNGISPNRVTANGISPNRVTANGISPNRVTANGVAANRVAAKHDKAARNRISVDPQVEVVGVKLSKN
jgi:hypothetical protein